MSFSRVIFSVLAVLLLAGCGDLSIRTLSNDEFAQAAAVLVEETGGRDGQIYSRHLREQLGTPPSSAATHRLKTTISSSSINTLSIVGSSSTLKKMTMTAQFSLINIVTGETDLAESISTNATLGTVSSYFGQDESETNGRQRLAKLLADRVARRVQLFFLDTTQ